MRECAGDRRGKAEGLLFGPIMCSILPVPTREDMGI